MIAVVKNGRNQHQDVLVYEYTDDEDRLFDPDSSEEEEEEEHEEPVTSPIPNNPDLPEYVPSYFPPFPTTIKQEEPQPTTGPTSVLATPLPPPTVSQQQQQPISTSGAPAPIIVRSRKRAIDNPFTHVVPFEESALAASAAEGGGGALSLTLDEENERQSTTTTTMNGSGGGEKKRRRTALSTIPMKNAVGSLTNKENPLLKRKARDELIGNHAMFRRMTQNEAAPGNTMFSSPTGVLAELLHRVAPPTLVSKLSAPNLLVDVATTTSNTSQQATSTPSQPASSTNAKDQPSRSTSGSMLASLAGGQYNRKQSNVEELGSPPVTTTATTTSTMTTTTASTPTTSTPTTTPTTTTPTFNNNTSTLTPISLASLSAGHEPSQQQQQQQSSSSSSSTKKKLPKLTLNLSNNDAPTTTTPSTAESTPTSTPKIRFKIKPPEDTSAPSTPNAHATSSPPQARPSSSSSSTPAYESETIQITDPITTTATSAATDIVPPDASGEIVRCICENPTVDYGTFMIACDKCGVWYHGTCVGVAESDQVEEWYCRNCT